MSSELFNIKQESRKGTFIPEGNYISMATVVAGQLAPTSVLLTNTAGVGVLF